MVMNRGKIFKIKTNENFKIKYGTVDNKSIKSIYINFTSWLTIEKGISNYQLLINKLKKRIKSETFESLNTTIFSSKLIIIDLDIRESGLRNSNQTFMSLDVNLYLKKELTFKDKELIDEINLIVKKINKVLEEYDEFEYHKTKIKI